MVTTQILQPFPSVACELGTFQLQYEAEAEEDNLICSYALAWLTTFQDTENGNLIKGSSIWFVSPVVNSNLGMKPYMRPPVVTSPVPFLSTDGSTLKTTRYAISSKGDWADITLC